MKRLVVLVLVCVSFAFTQQKSEKLKKVSLAEGKVKVLIPESMRLLSDEEVVKQYGVLHIPLAVYQDQSSYVSYSISEKIDTLSQSTGIDYASIDDMSFDNNVELERKFYRSTLSNIYDDIKFITDEVKTIKKQKVVVFELEGTTKGKSKLGKNTTSQFYTYISYVFIENRKYIFNFNCPIRYKKYWEPLIKQSMEGLKVK